VILPDQLCRSADLGRWPAPRRRACDLSGRSVSTVDLTVQRLAVAGGSLALPAATAALGVWIFRDQVLGGGRTGPLHRWDARGGLHGGSDALFLTLAAGFFCCP